MNKTKLFLFIFFFLNILIINAQDDYFIVLDSVKMFIINAEKAQNDTEKLNFENKALQKLYNLLLKNNPTKMDFTVLKDKISVLSSSDKNMKIFTWGIQLSDGTYKYYGLVWHKSKNKDANTFVLYDNKKKIRNPENQVLTSDKWFGAIYYQLIERKYKKHKIYTLIGWDGKDRITNRKVIEVLTFKGNKLRFGGVFVLPYKIVKRLIYEYSEQAVMVIRWDKKIKMIVMDHLAPSKPQFVGVYQYYGPDFTYDGLKFEKGKWILKENIIVKNPKPKKK